MGLGSSLIIKMTVDSALRKLGIEADVETCDMGGAKAVSYTHLRAHET